MQATRPMLFILLVVMVAGLMVFKPSHAEIYKWVDDNGTVHFTEDPTTIPEKYLGKTKVRENPESSERKAPSTSRNPQYTYPLRRQPPVTKQVNEDSQECGLGEYETNAFMMRYLGGGRSPLAPKCRDILKKCCNYSHRGFAEIVDKYAKDAKWNVIPERIPGLLSRYCGNGSYETDNTYTIPAEVEEPPTKKKYTRETNPLPNPGAINTRTGEFYPGVAGGIINPRTGEFMPDVGGGYIDPKTGRFIPKQ